MFHDKIIELKNYQIHYALNFHEITKHTYSSVRTIRHYLDWQNRPYPFKVYLNLPKIMLSKNVEKPNIETHKALETPYEYIRELDMKDLSEILFFSYGITRIMNFGYETYHFRAAPATGALYPIEIYVIVNYVKGLENGVYHFDPGEFNLTMIRKGDYMGYLYEYSGRNEILRRACVAFIFSSLAWRNAWKYRERSYRHWFWDCGVIIANMIALLNSKKLKSEVIMGFVDEKIDKLIGIDGIEEATVAILAVEGNKEIDYKNEEVTAINPDYVKVSKNSKIYDEIVKINKASSLVTPEEVIDWLKNCIFSLNETHEFKDKVPLDLPIDISTDTLGETILKRGSTRKFSLDPISIQQLSILLHYSTKPIVADFLPLTGQSFIDVYFIANNVEGLQEGAYYYNKDAKFLEVIKKGKYRKVAGYLCLEQELAAEASVVFFLMSNLKEILKRLGNRGYRVAQIEGGIVAGRIYLMSYSLNLGATGLTFYDDEITEFFSPHAENKNNIIVVAVGKPAYRAKKGKIYIQAVNHDEYLRQFGLVKN